MSRSPPRPAGFGDQGTSSKASQWAGLTTRKSRVLIVASVTMLSRSAIAMTAASTVPRSMSAYLVDEFGDAFPVVWGEIGDGEVTGGDRGNEGYFGGWSEHGGDHPSGFGDHWCRQDQLIAAVAGEQVQTSLVPSVVLVSDREQHAGVDNDHSLLLRCLAINSLRICL